MRALVPWHYVHGLYYEAEIPPKVVARARRIARVPKTERVIAVLDGLGEALVFTEAGLFHGGLMREHGFLLYPELVSVALQTIDENTVEVGPRKFRFVDWPAGALYDIIRVARDAASNVADDVASDITDSTLALTRDFEGAWRGAVRQHGVRPYSVELLIAPAETTYVGSAVGKITYPELDCGGSLTLISSSRNKLRVGEVVASGVRKCVSGGEITIELTGADTASWSWADGKTRHLATSTIHRQKHPEAVLPQGQDREVRTLSVPANAEWIATGVTVHKDDDIKVSASGGVTTASFSVASGPEGQRYICDASDCIGRSQPFAILLGRIGGAQAFVIGAAHAFRASRTGELRFAVNDKSGNYSDNTGSFDVTIVIEHRRH
jgi:hypothetical protein